MNDAVLQGVGLIGQAVADLCLKKDYALAFTDFMKGLGAFGVHSTIGHALQAPPGKAAPQLKAMLDKEEIGKPEPPEAK